MSKTAYFFVALSIIFLASCTNSKYPGYKQADNNVYYKFITKSNDTTKVRRGNFVAVNLSYKTTDSLLFDNKTLGEELVFPVLEHTFQGDLYDALSLMNPGDSMNFVIVADSFYLKTAQAKKLPDFIKPGEPIYYTISLKRVETKEEHEISKQRELILKQRDETRELIKYVKANKIAIAPNESGLYYIEKKKGRGKTIKKGDVVSFRISIKELNGNLLFSNLADDKAAISIEYGQQFDTKGFNEALGLMRKGGVADLIVPSRVGVGRYGMSGVEGFTTLLYTVKIEDITPAAKVRKQKEAEARKRDLNREPISKEEDASIKKWLKSNGINVKPQPSGFYFINIAEGKGKRPKHGNTVSVHYKLYNLNGEVIDSSMDKTNPFTFMLGTNAVIDGWEKAIKLMKEGGSATVVIPSNLAYGKQGRGKIIPPNTTLIFDINLLSVK